MKPNVSAGLVSSSAIKRRRRYNYRPLNNLIGKMIDTTITRNQNRGGAIRPLRVAEGAASNPTIAHRRFNQEPVPNGFLSSLNCNNGHCFCLAVCFGRDRNFVHLMISCYIMCSLLVI